MMWRKLPKAVGGDSRWIGIEVTINNTPKIVVSAHFPHERLPLGQFTATLEESDTLGKSFPKHEVPIGLDAIAKLASHSDGFRVGNAVPNSDMTAGDEERATFFVNFMAKNGLVARNTRTSGSSTTRRNVHKEKSGTDTRYWAISQLEHRWARF